MPIPFAGYARLSDHKGSFADESGILTIEDKSDELYVFTCVGYLSDTIIPSKAGKIIYLKPKVIQLESVTVSSKKLNEKDFQIDQLGGCILNPYHSSITRKMEICTYLPAFYTKKDWVIKSIKLDIGGRKSNVYKAFLIRLFIKELDGKLPGKDLLTKNMVVSIDANSYGYKFLLEETVLLPQNGCFVGFETVSKIDKNNKFIPFTDFYKKPDKSFEFVIRMVKSDALSLFRIGGFDSWFSNKDRSNSP